MMNELIIKEVGGITRAKEAGFDICFFNLHKTFGTPHGCGGPAVLVHLALPKILKSFFLSLWLNMTAKNIHSIII